jgi:large subunit ribosomal protein L16
MMPKRVLYRKSQRGKMKGNATRGNTVAFGEYGLQSLEMRVDHGAADRGGPRGVQPLSAPRRPRVHPDFPHKPVSRPSRWKPAWARARASRNIGARS